MEKRKLKKILPVILFLIPGTLFLIIDSIIQRNSLSFRCNDMFVSCPDISGELQVISNEEYNIDYIDKIIAYEENIFPDEIPNNSTYFSFEKECYSDMGWVYLSEIYLKCDFDQINYDREVQRLMKLQIGNKMLVESNNLFILPSLVGVYNENGMFEYVILDDENHTLRYIYFWGIEKKKNLVFENEFIPRKKLKKSDFPKKLIRNGGYSVYITNE